MNNKKEYYFSDQLCWDCKNACGGCEWSKSLEPVPGWKAKKIKKVDHGFEYETYSIKKCPKFERG